MSAEYERIVNEKDLNKLTNLEWCIWFAVANGGKLMKTPIDAAEELAALKAESESRRVTLLEKSEELRKEWTRAESAEAERDAHLENMRLLIQELEKLNEKTGEVQKLLDTLKAGKK